MHDLTLTRTGNTLVATASLPSNDVETVEFQIESSRNQCVSKLSDVSPFDPSGKPREEDPNRELFFPVIDIIPDGEIEAVAVFNEPKSQPSTAIYAVNGQFIHEYKHLHPRKVIIPASQLEHWENALLVEKEARELERFYLRLRRPVINGQVRVDLQLLSPQWSGSVALCEVSADGVQELAVSTLAEPRRNDAGKPRTGSSLNARELLASLSETLRFLLRAQNINQHSRTSGGLNLFYDLDARSFRTSHWIWTWGPSVRLMLDAARREDLDGVEGAQLEKVAHEIGARSLEFEVKKRDHPADGMWTIRWSPSLYYYHGYEEMISPPDALFLAGWAWARLFDANGDNRYIEAGARLTRATERLLEVHDVVPQDYEIGKQRWIELVRDEAGFGPEGLAELYRVTGDEWYNDVARRYMSQLLDKLEREDGLWNRHYFPSSGAVRPTQCTTRGLGWAMEGLLSCHRSMPKEGYLERAQKMAEHLVSWQHPSGCWSFEFDKSAETVGISEKGTALWSLLFYRLYSATGQEKHLMAARKALQWCIDNQYFGPDTDAHGSIVGCSPASGVSYRSWFRLACAYTSAFFGLAVLEELKILGGTP